MQACELAAVEARRLIGVRRPSPVELPDSGLARLEPICVRCFAGIAAMALPLSRAIG